MKAFEEANAFLKASKFPNFLKIMTKSNAGYCFVLVSSYFYFYLSFIQLFSPAYEPIQGNSFYTN